MQRRGFTLIELLVVIAIIGLLATFAVVQLSNANKKARDARRLSDIKHIQTSLEMYRDQYGQYPDNTDMGDGAGGWDVGCLGGPSGGDIFIDPLRTSKVLGKTMCDPKGTGVTNTYLYYRYTAGTAGCDPARGAFYVLIAQASETGSGSALPSSPGWSCPSRDWGTAAGVGVGGPTPAYATGAFEN
jgi:prepilin-type N-terminal cleavage/methylation domain-containing protein